MCLWCYRRKKCRVRKPSAVALQQSMAHGGKGVYGVALKWEKHSDSTDWCEARLVTKPKVARLMKWVMFQHPNLARVGGFLHSRFPSWGFLISRFKGQIVHLAAKPKCKAARGLTMSVLWAKK